MKKKQLLWIIPLSFIIGCLFYGYLQVESQKPLINMLDYCINDFNINIEEVNNNINEMDAHHHSYAKCLDNIDEDKKEDIVYQYIKSRIKWCNIEIEDEYIAYEPCDIEMSLWGENESIGFQIKPSNSILLINTGITLELGE